MAGISIKAGKYNEKIRDMIRDFYALGWKTTQDMEGSAAGISGDVKRIREAIVDENVKWYGWHGEAYRNRTLSLSVDAHHIKDNPFHRAYWYCTHSASDLSFFFGMILLLSPKTTFDYDRTFLSGLFFGEDADVSEVEFDQLKRWYSEEKEKQKSLSNKAIRLFLMNQSEIPPYGYDDNGDAVLVPTNDYNTVRRRMEEFLKIGIVERADGGRKPKGEKEGEHWKLSDCFLDELIRLGRKTDSQFEENWRAILSFYSRYFPFGEVGTGILRRLQWDSDDAVHILDDYYMQSLSDFVLYDILDAIERNQWCCVRYKTGTRAESHIVKPMQIRIGLSNGRQHLLAFNINNMQVDTLLVSAISSVDVISDYADICKAYEAVGRKLPSEEEVQLSIQDEERKLTELWGVSVPFERQGKENTESLEIVFECAPEHGEALYEQLNREKRSGKLYVDGNKIVFHATVTDGREVIPWIRKYYGCIRSVAGINTEKYSLEEDVRSMCDVMCRGLEAITVLPGRTSDMKPRTDYCAEVTPRCSASEEHNSLFHECFSEDYMITADWLMRVVFSERLSADGEITYGDMKEMFRQVCEERGYCVAKDGNGNDDSAERLFDESIELIDESRILRFVAGGDKRLEKRKYRQMLFPKSNERFSFYRDLFPLTKAERRWLVSILEDSGSRMFLLDDTIEAIKSYLNATPLPMRSIVYYDRPFRTAERRTVDAQVIKTFRRAAAEQRMITIVCTEDGKSTSLTGCPLFAEYSKRDDEYRLIIAIEDEGHSCCSYRVLKLNQVLEIQMTESCFDRRQMLKQYRKSEANRLELKIQFADAKNLANRLFTEMAPWERQSRKVEGKIEMLDPLTAKKMVYNQYTVELRYDMADAESLVRKMLSAGPYLRFVEGERTSQGVASEYQRRLERQLELLRNNN